MKTSRKAKITKQAMVTLENHPGGLRYSELVKALFEHFGNIPVNTIHGTVWNLHERYPDKTYKPSRGLFRLVKFRSKDTDSLVEKFEPKTPETIKEEDFYSAFADWLINELEECTKAIPLGGNRFKDKWGTPDVIGKKESFRSDIIQGPIEIISAEIKLNISELVTAFGQACSYRLFSHKSYLVIPMNAPQDEVARLDSLCMVFGIGLILFDSTSPDNPLFNIRVRSIKHEPDMFYVNKYMKYIEKELFV